MLRLPVLFALTFIFTLHAEEPKPPVKEEPKKEEAKDPPSLDVYKGRHVAQTMHYTGAEWLIRESRERQEECSKLMKNLHIKEGQVICDLGCGNGFYALKFAPLVGDKGKIICEDVQKEMLDMLKKRADQAGIKNLEYVLGGYWDPKLAEDSCDMIFLADVYHEFDHPIEMLEHIRKSLKPTGRLVLVEFRAEDPKVPIKPLHKMSKEQILKEIPINGFKLVEQYDELPWQHVMFFERDDAAAKDERKVP